METVQDSASRTDHEVTLIGLRKDTIYDCEISCPDGQPVRFECDTHFDYTLAVAPDRPDPYLATGPALGEAAERLLTQTRCDRGICIVLGCGSGELVYELARRESLRVIGFDTDEGAVAQARRELLAAGIYGARAAVHCAESLQSVAVVGAMANIVVAADSADVPDEAKRLVQPGGEVFFGSPDHWQRWVRPPLEAAGVWTDQYGTPAAAAFGGETLGGATRTDQLRVQWVGHPGPRYQPDRNGRKPAPLAVNARLFGQGRRRIVAVDAYNGTILWALEIPALARFNMPRDCGNWSADESHVFAAVKDCCWRIDAATGTVQDLLPVVPGPQDAWQWDWGYVASAGELLLGSAVKAGSAFVAFVGHANWYDNKEGEATFKVCSENLFAIDKATGKQAWRYDGGVIVNSTIVVDDGKICFVESRSDAVRNSDSRRVGMTELWDEQFMVAVDVRTGSKLWERPLKTAPGSVVFYMAAGGGKLVIVASDVADAKYHTYAFDGGSGEAIWQSHFDWMSDNHGGHMSHPGIASGRVFVRPRVLDLETGKILDVRMPGGGCGTYAMTDKTAIFRSAHVVLWEFDANTSTSWHRLRPGCWISTVPACGMVLSPEAGGGCSCGSWLETSVGFMPGETQCRQG